MGEEALPTAHWDKELEVHSPNPEEYTATAMRKRIPALAFYKAHGAAFLLLRHWSVRSSVDYHDTSLLWTVFLRLFAPSEL